MSIYEVSQLLELLQQLSLEKSRDREHRDGSGTGAALGTAQEVTEFSQGAIAPPWLWEVTPGSWKAGISCSVYFESLRCSPARLEAFLGGRGRKLLPFQPELFVEQTNCAAVPFPTQGRFYQ